MINNSMQNESRIYVAGHMGMVGSAIVRELKSRGFGNLILRTKKELDLLNQEAVCDFFSKEKPDYVFLAAAKVGGFQAIMTYPAEFLFENLQIQNNIIWAAHKFNVKKLLFLSSSCIYPNNCIQPMKEEYLMDGKVDLSSESYAIAKIAGMELCRFISRQYGKNFISCAPTNIYGENDSFDVKSTRVVASLVKKFHEAKLANAPAVTVFGTGNARREFICVKDLAEACIFLMKKFNFSDELYFINVGTGDDIKIADLAQLIKSIVGYEGKISWDVSKPDGVQNKLLDVTKINRLGWKSEISLADGLKQFYSWYKSLV
jgi:GDP-L-fucose synthase